MVMFNKGDIVVLQRTKMYHDPLFGIPEYQFGRECTVDHWDPHANRGLVTVSGSQYLHLYAVFGDMLTHRGGPW